MKKVISVFCLVALLLATGIFATQNLGKTWNSDGKVNGVWNTEKISYNETKYFYTDTEISLCRNPDVNLFDIKTDGDLVTVTAKQPSKGKTVIECFGKTTYLPIYIQFMRN